MQDCTEGILHLHCTAKLYDKMCQAVCTELALSRTEIDVLAFLTNHPQFNTASDIVRLRMIPKANVSQAVEALIQKGYLIRQPDDSDRRRVRLLPTKSSAAPAHRIQQMQRDFFSVIFSGFSEAERTAYFTLQQKIAENSANAVKGVTAVYGEK